MSEADHWRGRAILVTGCSGFLGTWLTHHLCRVGARVVGFSRNRPAEDVVPPGYGPPGSFEWCAGDVTDSDLLRRTIADRAVDTVFHLAARSKPGEARTDPAGTFAVNAGGTWSLLDAVRRVDRRVGVVLASTDAVYGDGPEQPFTEDSPLVGDSPYASSKICAESVARSFHAHFGVPVAIARTTYVYGGGDWGFTRLVPGTVRSVLKGEAPVIQSDGRPERDFLYVEDVVDGYLRLGAGLSRSDVEGEVFNFASEVSVSVAHVVAAVLQAMGRTDLAPQVLGQSTPNVSRVSVSASRAGERLGWQATASLEDGLERTVSWYRTFADRITES